MKTISWKVFLIAGFILLAGCATRPGNPGNVPPQRRDPIASVNRKIYTFNMFLDRHVTRPIAKGYVKITSQPVRSHISDFFSNLSLPVTIFNDLLQLKPLDAVRDTGRLAVNTTLGFAGFFDPASDWSLQPHSEDFGITLARWGVPSGPYLQIPFLGPSDVRDAVGKIPDYFVSPSYWSGWKPRTRYSIDAIQLISERANFLNEDQLLEQSYDPYALLRSVYFQNRDQTIRKNMPNYHPGQTLDYEKMLQESGSSTPAPSPSTG